MIERIDLNARWGDRQESLDTCANRASVCLRKLAECDAVFGQWYLGGRSRKEALERRFGPTLEACRTLLDKGRNYRDIPRTLIEELGYMMGLWNGLDGDSAINVRFQVGAYPAVTAMPTPNECMIDLPYGGAAADRLLQEDKLRLMMRAVIESWDPDWARISTFQMHQAVYGEEYRCVSVGWLTYLSDRYGPPPMLPGDYQVTRIEGLGSLITIKGIDRLTASNPAHVERVRRLLDILRAADLLSPTPPASLTR